jgi:hypothetical protein
MPDPIRYPGFVPTKFGNHLKIRVPAGVYPVAERCRNDCLWKTAVYKWTLNGLRFRNEGFEGLRNLGLRTS